MILDEISQYETKRRVKNDLVGTCRRHSLIAIALAMSILVGAFVVTDGVI